MRTLEQHMAYLAEQNEKYHWPLVSFRERIPERTEIHKDFPYVVTYAGNYGHNGGRLDLMDDWCREKFGDAHGECHWRECEYSFDKWYEDNGFEEEMDRLYDEKAGPRPNEKKKRAWNKWQKITSKIVDEHFEMIEQRIDKPGEHWHRGIWTGFFVVKTGYDYGYQDYCFKNPEDAVYFKLMWEGEQK